MRSSSLKHLYLRARFFYAGFSLVFLFVLGFMVPLLYEVSRVLFFALLAAVLFELVFLFFSRGRLVGWRVVADRLSNGDENPVQLLVTSEYARKIEVEVLEEAPVVFQLRDLSFLKDCLPNEEQKFEYKLRPTERGRYQFGMINAYAIGPFGLLARRFKLGNPKEVAVYPSYIQMRKYDLMAISNHLKELGIKKIRQRGQSQEYDHIKNYVLGDEVRHINWKATARRRSLMVNTYEDEKSQQVICLLDKGRSMRSPFNGMSLMDYAINSSLVLSNIAHKKQDKPGIITFNRGIDEIVAPSKASSQIHKIMEVLYHQDTTFAETGYDMVFPEILRHLKRRSLLLLFTNFDSESSLMRQIDWIRGLAHKHVLVLIFFLNTELDDLATKPATSVRRIYQKTMAQKFRSEKRKIVTQLGKMGIYTVLTKPEELTVDTINMYLSLKARGVI